jgi:hypothetical protein
MAGEPLKGRGVMPKQLYTDEAGMYNIRLGWTPGDTGHVQVGIESADGRPIVERLAEGGSDPAQFKALWGTLHRTAINALIRDLRKARDSVYGADA